MAQQEWRFGSARPRFSLLPPPALLSLRRRAFRPLACLRMMALGRTQVVWLPAFASPSLLHPAAHVFARPRFLCSAQSAASRQSVVIPRKKIPTHARPIVPAKPLLHFVEDKAQPRKDVIRAICAYAKEHNLQNPENRRIIQCDDVLKSVLGVDQCTILEVLKHASPHFRNPETMGGRYLEEANAVEQAYIDELLSDGTPKKKARSKSQARKVSAKEDKKAGRNLYRTYRLSPELAAVCRAPEMRRHEVVRAVWEYIRMNNLNGLGPMETPVKCDFLMRKVFNADYINVKMVMSGISPHIQKKE